MREILFRGKNINDGHWLYGTPVSLHSGEIYMNFEFSGWIDRALVYPETVGQYTGLCDKSGKKIFEGDILHVEQCGETGSRISPVHFGEYIDADSVFDNYRCIGFYVKTSDGCCTIGALLSEEFECEVIGNIYDDPELMKTK